MKTKLSWNKWVQGYCSGPAKNTFAEVKQQDNKLWRWQVTEFGRNYKVTHASLGSYIGHESCIRACEKHCERRGFIVKDAANAD